MLHKFIHTYGCVYVYIHVCVYVSVCQAKIGVALLKIVSCKMCHTGTARVGHLLKWSFYVNKGKMELWTSQS